MTTDYDWCGFGLTLRFPNGTVWLQGDEASQLYDRLEACETHSQVVNILDEYSHLAEEDDE